MSSVPAALVIRVYWFEGRYHGSGGWPPAPARLFQALVAGVAVGRTIAEPDRVALRWLEAQGAPSIAAPAARRGQGISVWVPNNDLDAVPGIATVAGNPAGYIKGSKGWASAASGIRAAKSVRPWLFDATRPVVYLWPQVTDDADGAGLIALAQRLYQLGRGIDPAWARADLTAPEEVAELVGRHDGAVHRPTATGAEGLAAPSPGSLASLEARHAAQLARFGRIGTGRKAQITFTNPPKPRFRQIRYDAPPRRLLFDIRQGSGGPFLAMPATEAAALVRRLIVRAAARLDGALPGQASAAERLLVGRGAGPADIPRRIRVFAVPTLREQVDRAVRRVAVEVPQDCPLRADDVAWAFAGLSPLEVEHDPASGELYAPLLVKAEDRAMLDRYCRPARVWRSETPLALPARRHRADPARPNRKRGDERLAEESRAAAALMAALRHAGVPARPASIRVQRDPFAARGTRAEAFARGTRFSGSALWHVEITFHEPIPGPLILGDGRFCGLGLMAPDTAQTAMFAFSTASALEGSGPEEIASALRRAVMSRVRDAYGSADLPSFFSGHLDGGGPMRDGTHAHLAFAADLTGRRLLVIPPHTFGHRDPDQHENELENLSPREGARWLLRAPGRSRRSPPPRANDDLRRGSAACPCACLGERDALSAHPSSKARCGGEGCR